MSATIFKGENWPSKAVVTAGMPYGNKPLHFGHIAGVFVPADCYARFLRDRIGYENVRFISGTDCYGSPIDEGYRKKVESEGFSGSIGDYVQENHDNQARALKAFDISLNIYEGSGIGHCGVCHQELTDNFIKRLYENRWLNLQSSLQFYDEEAGIFLNGRQVVGRCPVQGCKSEKGYADECDLGHSYAPEDLIAPVSTVSNTTPAMKPVENWYFDLPAFKDFLRNYNDGLAKDENIRSIVPTTCLEFLGEPTIYIKNEERENFDNLANTLPSHKLIEAEKGKASFEVVFSNIEERDAAREILRKEGLRFRAGKTLVPFRITGNIEWGVKAPVIEGVEGLTVWCWPESLWAPVSFTMAAQDESAPTNEDWHNFWYSENDSDESCEIYQFIGQDNLYFYGVVQPALWEALRPGDIFSTDPAEKHLRQTRLIANHHVLFGDKKASSSGAIKPPTAEELLDHYNPEHLRAHFLALGLDQKSVGFKPKAYEAEEVRNDPRVADPVLKESKLLQNVFNRLARSVLYEAAKNFNGTIPVQEPSQNVVAKAQDVLRNYDKTMKKAELHSIITIMDEFIRFSNKHWADGIANAESENDSNLRTQVLADAAYLLWICTLLMHPIVPKGCEDICTKLQFAPVQFFSWNHQFASLEELVAEGETSHSVEALEPRYDFF